jgi:hypothetical protein
VLQEEDFEKFMASDKLFARKFDERNGKTILEKG